MAKKRERSTSLDRMSKISKEKNYDNALKISIKENNLKGIDEDTSDETKHENANLKSILRKPS